MESFENLQEKSDLILTPAGKHLRDCMLFGKKFDASLKNWKNLYRESIQLRQNTINKLSNAKTVLLTGAGMGSKEIPKHILEDPEIFKIGVNYAFYLSPNNFDLTIATHSPAVQCASRRSPKMTVAHASYSKVPPIVRNSFTFGWADPRFELKRYPTSNEVASIAKATNSSFLGDTIFPRTRATRNIFFVSLMLILSSISEGSEIILTGFDPENGGYYSTGDKGINSMRLQDALQTNFALNTWDGRNERLEIKKFSQQDIIKQTAMTMTMLRIIQLDAQGITYKRRLVPEFIEAFPIYLEAIRELNLKISYIGASSLCEKFQLNKR